MTLAVWIGIFRRRWHSVESGGWSGLVSEGRGTVGFVVSSSLRTFLVDDMPVGGRFRCRQQRRRLCHWCVGKAVAHKPASGSHDQPRLELDRCGLNVILFKCEMARSYSHHLAFRAAEGLFIPTWPPSTSETEDSHYRYLLPLSRHFKQWSI